jgi:tetratricopeptide (TPR) repeat protein
MCCLRQRTTALLLLTGFLTLAVFAQGSPTFTEEEGILAIDLPVAYDKKAFREWFSGKPVPLQLNPEDFEVMVNGKRQQVISATAPTPEDEPWHMVVWLDLTSFDPVDVRWAATLLAERADDLVRLGTVEAMIVDSIDLDAAPRRLFSPTRNADEIRDAVSRLALFPEGGNSLLNLRSAFVEEVGDDQADPELVAALVAEEERLVLRRQDLLLTWLTGRDSNPGGRRVLMLMDGGFDFDPAAFYRPFLGTPVDERTDSPMPDTSSPLRTSTEDLARTLASYGWITLPTLPPEPELLVKGMRIGKWLFHLQPPHGEAPTDEQINRAAANESTERAGLERLGRVWLFNMKGKRQEHRDPDTAEAYLELGNALSAQEKLEEAEEALQKSLYHFAEDPRTAPRQAVAMANLAAVLEMQGKAVAARQAFENARTLDPDILAEGQIVVGFLNPTGPLRQLTQVTSGQLVRQRQDLQAALADLAERLRVTYQLSTVSGDLPDGQLAPLELRFKGVGDRLIFPAWSRNGTPETVSAARLRRLLEAEGEEDFLPVLPSGEPILLANLILDPEAQDKGSLHLRLHLGKATDSLSPPMVPRLSLAFSKVDETVSIEHRLLTVERLEGTVWEETVPLTVPVDTARLAVVVEDLIGGTWGAAWTDF